VNDFTNVKENFENLKIIFTYRNNAKGRARMDDIDKFVEYLIRENCEGCKECEPRLSSKWKPNFACVEEGRAKWLLTMAEKYKGQKGTRE